MTHITPYDHESLVDQEIRARALRPRFPPLSEMLTRIPPHFRGKGLDDYEPRSGEQEDAKAVVEKLLKFIRPGEPIQPGVPGLTLIGHPGLGKTLLACIVLNHAHACRKSFDFMPVADFVDLGHKLIGLGKQFDRLSDDDYHRYRALSTRIEQMTEVKVLVLDDFGKEHSVGSVLPGAASWAESEFDRIIRNRWNTGVGPTIITTNVFLDDWEMRYRESLSSFLHESTTICELKERNDWRGETR